MGSLTSRPKVPQVQQPVIMSMPAYAPPLSSTPESEPPAPSEATNSEEAQRLAREDNLLRRSRGRLGTVLTGFSGILTQAATPARKTLLGE